MKGISLILFPYKGFKGLLFFEDVVVGTAKVYECFGLFAAELYTSEILDWNMPVVIQWNHVLAYMA